MPCSSSASGLLSWSALFSTAGLLWELALFSTAGLASAAALLSTVLGSASWPSPSGAGPEVLVFDDASCSEPVAGFSGTWVPFVVIGHRCDS
ncbi:Uncharacterised protein [Mycobacteroides abscessus subsp. abscessus]|nr:Uncharacterised protein [Mycobacteroides abscessus subsp. abscessus]